MPPQPVAKPKPFDFKQPIVLGGGALVLILVLAVVFLLMRRPAGARQPQDMAPDPLAAGAAAGALPAPNAVDQRLQQQLADNLAEQAQLEAETMGRIKLPANTKKSDVLVRHIRESVQKDPVTAANVLRTWVADMDSRKTS